MKSKYGRMLAAALLASAALPVFAQNVAVVNGKPIPTSRVETMVKQITAQGQQDTPQLRAMIKEELINREILMQEANRVGIANQSEVRNQIELARQSIVIRALVADYVKKNPITEPEMRAEYKKFTDEAGDKEYRARHILVETEDQAKDIIAKLKAGAKFEELAKQSKDPGSAAQGGDLDWNAPGAYVKPFSEAMVALKKGDYTQAPVKTDFGYHVIKLEDVRAAQLPTFEELKPQIAEALQQRKLGAYQEKLRKGAKIQ